MAVVVVAREDVVEHDSVLRCQVSGSYASGSSSSTSLTSTRAASRVSPSAPVEHEPICDVLHQLACDPLTSSRWASLSSGSGFVRRSKTASSGSESPSLTVRLSSSEVARHRLQPAQHLVDVQAPGVVGVDQLAQLLDEIQATRVTTALAPPGRLLASRWAADRLRPARRAASASKSIVLRSISASARPPLPRRESRTPRPRPSGRAVANRPGDR